MSRSRFLVGSLLAFGTIVVSAPAANAHVIGLTIDGRAPLSVGRTVATATGMASCTVGEPDATVTVQIIQTGGRGLASGFGSTLVPCTGTPQPWTVLVATVAEPFKSGRATALVSMFTNGPDGFDDEQRSIRIRLKN